MFICLNFSHMRRMLNVNNANSPPLVENTPFPEKEWSFGVEIDSNLSSGVGVSHQTASSAAQKGQRESSPRPALHTRFLSSKGTMDGFPDLPVVSPTPLRMMDDL